MSVTTGRGTPSSASHRRGGWYWHANGRGNNDQNGSAQCPRFCLLSLGSKYSMASNALSVASSDMDVNDEQHTQTVDVEFYSEYQDEEFEGGMDQGFVQGEQEGGSKKKRVSIVMEGQKRGKSAVAMKDIGQVLGEKNRWIWAAWSHLITTNPNNLNGTNSLLRSIKGNVHESIKAQTMAITDTDPPNSILHTGRRLLSFLMASTSMAPRPCQNLPQQTSMILILALNTAAGFVPRPTSNSTWNMVLTGCFTVFLLTFFLFSVSMVCTVFPPIPLPCSI